jgi:hypothetical protein
MVDRRAVRLAPAVLPAAAALRAQTGPQALTMASTVDGSEQP